MLCLFRYFASSFRIVLSGQTRKFACIKGCRRAKKEAVPILLKFWAVK